MCDKMATYFIQSYMIVYVYLYVLTGGRVIEKEDGSGQVLYIGLGDLLSFVTGADGPPPLGFSVSPAIKFTDDPQRVLPKASTCTLTLLYICASY